jgi:hypothetical protein
MIKLDYLKMKEEFDGNEVMIDNISRLEMFDIFHCLLASNENVGNEIANEYNIKNEELRKWLKYCDGGLLFDTVVLSKQAYDEENDMEFDSYEDYNKDKEKYDLDEKYFIIGFRSYGDIICINMAEDNSKIYLLNIETGEFDQTWDSFTDWLAEEIDEGIQLIADDILDPIEAKLED